jgi:hypothetical protein
LKVSVNAVLIYGGLLIALIAAFLPIASETTSAMGISLGEQDVSMDGAAKFVVIVLVAATAWLAWPVLSGTLSFKRLIGLSVVAGALLAYALYGFALVGNLSTGDTSATPGLGVLLMIAAVIVAVVGVVRVWLARRQPEEATL